jgi:hypothetical protein
MSSWDRRNGRCGIRYTVVSMAIVTGIALATMYCPNRRADAMVAARDFAWDGSRIELAAGTYAEPIQLDEPVEPVADGAP